MINTCAVDVWSERAVHPLTINETGEKQDDNPNKVRQVSSSKGEQSYQRRTLLAIFERLKFTWWGKASPVMINTTSNTKSSNCPKRPRHEMNKWNKERRNERINEWMKWWMDEWLGAGWEGGWGANVSEWTQKLGETWCSDNRVAEESDLLVLSAATLASTPQIDCIMILQNVGNYLLRDKHQHPRKYESSSVRYKLCVCSWGRTHRGSNNLVFN
jgi:hypothetical protein